MTRKEQIGVGILVSSTLLAILIAIFIGPIFQDEGYHQFSDETTIGSVPNFWNVISNLPFLVIGCMGIRHFRNKKIPVAKAPYFLFFGGVAMVGLGSAYYHFHPTAETLVWDRLPMTVAFTSLFSIVFTEFVSKKWGQFMLWPLVGLGLLSILFWQTTGDLRLYGLVQFYPMVAMLVVLVFFSSSQTPAWGYWWLFGWYVVAKLFEAGDVEIHEVLGIMSGHPLKHFAAAIGIYGLLRMYQKSYA